MQITIVGNGKMALSLKDGLKNTHEVTIIARDTSRTPDVNTIALENNTDITDQIVLFCVKPHVLKPVSAKLTGKAKAVISILAGTTLHSLQENLQAQAYVRAMPNLAATYGESITSLTGDESFSEEAKEIFNSIGKSVWLSSEKELDIATAIGGSGPAFLALVAEALSDGGVNSGLKRDDANQIVKGLFNSFNALIQEQHPALLKDAVMSPGGTTSAGVTSLEASGVRDAFIKAISDANTRAKELAKQN